MLKSHQGARRNLSIITVGNRRHEAFRPAP